MGGIDDRVRRGRDGQHEGAAGCVGPREQQGHRVDAEALGRGGQDGDHDAGRGCVGGQLGQEGHHEGYDEDDGPQAEARQPGQRFRDDQREPRV
eukprot:scaffold332497_cov43-Prasinocladus_malaysianus.AAC.1